MKTSTIEDLAYLIREAKEQGLPKPIVFLGAGASKTGKIPLASEIVENILDQYKKNPKVKKFVAADEDKTYPALMECLTPSERNKLLKGYIDNAKINVTHIYLAQLINRGYIDYVLTVNFDNLMLRALALYNEFPPTYDMAILKDLTTTTPKEKTVVYLHGQHHGLWLLNTPEEMEKVQEIIPPILNSIKDRLWIFIGYSGEDPIFRQIVKLGRFDKGLYWASYYDEIPNETVCKELLEKDNTNSFLIKEHDADSFMLKLNNELELPQPFIIDKPFTSLKISLESIVDIDDKEHFKGVKERLEIVKKEVDKAIEQFEEGNIEAKESLKEEVDSNLLKKQIIDKIIKKEFDKKDIESLKEKANNLKNIEIINLLAGLYLEWGNEISRLAKLKNDEVLYQQCIEKYEKAAALNPNYDSAFYNLGLAIADLAGLKKDETLYKQSIEKYEKATVLNPKHDSAFDNWGIAIANLARLNNDEVLCQQSFGKFEKATALNPKDDSAFINWGIAIADLAELKKDEVLSQQSFEKFEKATALNPKNDSAFYSWGTAILDLAKLKDDETLYKQSIEKYEKATALNPKNDSAFCSWGTAILDLAKLKDDETLYQQSIEKYKKATALNPKNYFAFYNWGTAVLDLAKLKDDETLYRQSIEKLNKAVELGGSSYSLACAYALTNDTKNALKYLQNSLIKKEITVGFIKEDDDWKAYKNDIDFIGLLKKY
jgi:tetratricopeptide (TPR) repeat protein